jgi:hypothetical protein
MTRAPVKKKSAASAASVAGKKATVTKKARAASQRASSRADYGAPIDGFFAKQPQPLRAILDELRKMVEKALPDATSSLKWGMPCYSLGGAMVCILSAHKSHVNLVLMGPPDAFADPDGLLEGGGKNGRHLKLTSLKDLPRAAVRGWLRTAAKLAREQ